MVVEVVFSTHVFFYPDPWGNDLTKTKHFHTGGDCPPRNLPTPKMKLACWTSPVENIPKKSQKSQIFGPVFLGKVQRLLDHVGEVWNPGRFFKAAYIQPTKVNELSKASLWINVVVFVAVCALHNTTAKASENRQNSYICSRGLRTQTFICHRHPGYSKYQMCQMLTAEAVVQT